MKPRSTNRPRMNTLNKGYRVKKTISHDVSSRQDDTERKLYIFRAQARLHERSNRKSGPHHFSSSTSKSTESSRSPYDPTPESEVEPPPSKRTNNEEAEARTNGGIFIDRIKAAMERESLAVAARAKSKREKAAAEPTSEADRNASGHVIAITQKANEELEEARIKSSSPEKEKPIKFLDSLGRRFTFPFETCATWQVRSASGHFKGLGLKLTFYRVWKA